MHFSFVDPSGRNWRTVMSDSDYQCSNETFDSHFSEDTLPPSQQKQTDFLEWAVLQIKATMIEIEAMIVDGIDPDSLPEILIELAEIESPNYIDYIDTTLTDDREPD